MVGRVLGLSLLCGLLFQMVGCGKSPEQKIAEAKRIVAARQAVTATEWWCAEHGVPKEMCGRCSPEIAAQGKKRGDWCEKHQCLKSQCFECDPRLARKFAAMRDARFGKSPPPAPGG